MSKDYKAAVLGANSFIGKALCDELNNRRYNVLEVTRDQLDICDYDSEIHMDIIRKIASSEYVYIASWAGTKDLYNEQINKSSCEGLIRILGDVLKTGKYKAIIQLGSQAEYGIHTGEVVDEKTECKPISAYGKYKLEFYQKAKEMCEKTNIRLIEYRLHSVYGKNRVGGVLQNVITCLKTTKECAMKTDCSQLFDYVYVDDCIDALLTAIDCELYAGIYNIGSGRIYHLYDYIEMVCEALSGEAFMKYGNYKDTKSPDFAYDISKLRHCTGWEPQIPFEKGIHEIL